MPRTLLFTLALLTLAACGSNDATPSEAALPPAAPAAELPIQEVELGPIDGALASEGQQLFETRCTTCHKLADRYIGPPLGGVMERREAVWVMNMILSPEKMLQVDKAAQELLAEYSVPMTNQNLTEADARAILEYLRQTQASL